MRSIKPEDHLVSRGVQAAYDLHDVRIKTAHYELLRLRLPPRKVADAEIECEIDSGRVGEPLAVHADYTISMYGADPETDERLVEEGPFATLQVTVSGLYVAHPLEPGQEPQEFSDEELLAFGYSAGLLALHPYAREFVSDATSRMGIPRLNLSPVVLDTDEAAEVL